MMKTPNANIDTDKVIWEEAELMAEHDYAKRHDMYIEGVLDMKLHGGFDEAGRYLSPRTRYRWAAVEAWQRQLVERGYSLLDASQDLLARGNYPNVDQQTLLLQAGLGKSFWDSLTITGIIEARGAMLVHYHAPHLQDIIEEDITPTATGHLSKGLLVAHGLDEGGDPDDPDHLGAHDQMWFAVRDLVFGKDAYPLPQLPPSIERPKKAAFFPQFDESYDFLFTLLTDVLMIEIRAAAFFDFCIKVIARRENFADRGVAKRAAVDMVKRIRTDENIHVAYLQTVLSELRSFTFKGKDGKRYSGEEVIDPVWRDMVEWHGATQFDLARARRQEELYGDIRAMMDKDKAAAFIASFKRAGEPHKTAAE